MTEGKPSEVNVHIEALPNDCYVEINGKRLQGVEKIEVTVEATVSTRLVLTLMDFNLDGQGLLPEVNVTDATLINEMRMRGYKVEIDDSDLSQELSATTPAEVPDLITDWCAKCDKRMEVGPGGGVQACVDPECLLRAQIQRELLRYAKSNPAAAQRISGKLDKCESCQSIRFLDKEGYPVGCNKDPCQLHQNAVQNNYDASRRFTLSRNID